MSKLKIYFKILTSLVIISLVTVTAFIIYLTQTIPNYKNLANYDPAITSRLYAKDGILLDEFALQKRSFVPIKFIPQTIQDAFLAAEFNLHEELSSPTDISGGHTGSIALYQELDKKSKANGDINGNLKDYWHQNARIEFRLASSSKKYCLDSHLSFILLVVLEAIIIFDNKEEVIRDSSSYQIPREYNSRDDSLLSKYHRSNFLTKKIANIQNQCLTNSIKQFKIDFEKKLNKS